MEITRAGNDWIRMEEESEEGNPILRRAIGFHRDYASYQEHESTSGNSMTPAADLVRALAQERQKVVDNERLSAREKRSLLDENRKALTIATGGSVTKTDSVVYGILIFGGIVLVVLAMLTTFYDLPKEVTISFVGTVLGGVIATIAQKLGKL
jgi:hypothetical protein